MIKRLFLFIIAPVFNFLQSCVSPLGNCIDEKISDSYYYSKSSDEEVVYSPMGNWFELGKTKFKADAKTFRPLSRDIGKDKDHIYFEHQPQLQVDHATFTISGEVLRDKDHVYFKPRDHTHELFVIEDADPETFQYVLLSAKNYYSYWGKDKNNFYLHYQKVHVDYQTFEFHTPDFVSDKNFVYRIEDSKLVVIDTVTAKPERVAASYFRMGNTIYYVNDPFNKLEFASIDEFKAIDFEYIQVNQKVIVKGKYFPYPAVDLATFQTFPDWEYTYSKDKNNVYYEGEVITGAEVATFELLGFLYAKDKHHVYYEKEMMRDVDPEKFYLKDGTTPTDGKTEYRNGKPFDDRNF